VEVNVIGRVAEHSIRSRILKDRGHARRREKLPVAEHSIRSRILKERNRQAAADASDAVAEHSIRSRILKAGTSMCIRNCH